MKKGILFLILVMAYSYPVCAQNEQVHWSVLGSGSDVSVSQGDVLIGTVGQVAVSNSSDGFTSVLAGFYSNPDAQWTIMTSVDNRLLKYLPAEFRLFQNFPNPFNPQTIIHFEVPRATHVTLKVYDILGRDIATLVDEELVAGSYVRTWNADEIPSGIYLYRLQTTTFTEVKKMALLR